ncbi:hypothetical protein ACFSM5_10975 [Lacibacterium aquatile]|uniref:Uncharacterized protein n=1 Tax=Lacibacterium aquatile TaxID=1168082 RepID=A0ABW5DQU8_9PROT
MSPREQNRPSRFMVSLRALASPMPLIMTVLFVLTVLGGISARMTWVTWNAYVYWMGFVPAITCLVLSGPFFLWCVERWDATYSRRAFGSWVVEPHVRKRGRRRPSNDFAALANFVKAHSQSHIVICGSYAGAWKRLTGVESF